MDRTTLNHVSEITGINPQVVKGLAIGMGVELIRIGHADTIRVDDARRLRDLYIEHETHKEERRRPVAI